MDKKKEQREINSFLHAKYLDIMILICGKLCLNLNPPFIFCCKIFKNHERKGREMFKINLNAKKSGKCNLLEAK